MSLERQTAQTNPELAGLEQKLVAFKIPETLWLYIYRDEARQAYHDTLWELVGDPTKDEGAAHPEIWTGEFLHLKHAHHTDTGKLIVVRQHMPEEPRSAAPKDFMITVIDMASKQTERLYAVGYQQKADMEWRGYYKRHTYALSDDPGADLMDVKSGHEADFPHMIVDDNPRGQTNPGVLSRDSISTETFTGNIVDLQTRARQFHNYYRSEEIGRLAGLYVEVSQVLNTPEPATMLA